MLCSCCCSVDSSSCACAAAAPGVSVSACSAAASSTCPVAAVSCDGALHARRRRSRCCMLLFQACTRGSLKPAGICLLPCAHHRHDLVYISMVKFENEHLAMAVVSCSSTKPPRAPPPPSALGCCCGSGSAFGCWRGARCIAAVAMAFTSPASSSASAGCNARNSTILTPHF